jgi:hypothetical protein
MIAIPITEGHGLVTMVLITSHIEITTKSITVNGYPHIRYGRKGLWVIPPKYYHRGHSQRIEEPADAASNTPSKRMDRNHRPHSYFI